MKKAYSYIRFSSARQELGASLQRQVELAKQYASEHNLELDPNSFEDLGVSAHKSKNAIEGALATFIKAVDAGRIKPGSYLLIESLDRLSRDHVDIALELFLSIIRRGITIVVIKDNQVFNKESIRDSWTKIIFALVEMARANAESVRKSGLVKDGWAKGREKAKQGGILTTMGPAWLRREGDTWVIIKEKADVVRRVFKMAYDGHGGPSIARIFNEEKVPTMRDAELWTNGPISAMLKSKAVIGTLSSRRTHLDDIPNYYPPIIKPELFNEVQERVKSRNQKGGQKFGAVRNLFSGISYCKQCGSKMRSVGSSKRGRQLVCVKAYGKAGCDAKPQNTSAIEKAILNRFFIQNRDLRPEPTQIENSERAELQSQLASEEKKLSNLIKLVEATGGADNVVERVVVLQRSIDKLKMKIRDVSESTPRLEDIADVQNWQDELETCKDPARIEELRLQIQASIRRFVRRVEVHPHELKVTLTYASGKVRTEDAAPFHPNYKPVKKRSAKASAKG